MGDTAGANDKSRHRCRGAARKTLTVKRSSGELRRRRSWKKTASLAWEGQERSQLSPRAGPEMTQSDQTTLAKKLTAQKKILPIIYASVWGPVQSRLLPRSQAAASEVGRKCRGWSSSPVFRDTKSLDEPGTFSSRTRETRSPNLPPELLLILSLFNTSWFGKKL